MTLRGRSIATIGALSLLLGCGGGGDGGGAPGSAGRTVTVKGRLPAPPTGLRVPAAVTPALSVSDAQKLVVATSGGGVVVVPVSNGAFSFEAGTEVPLGVVFAGPGDVYLGFLAIREVAALPLQAVDAGVTTIDLGTLVASGTVVAPGSDPVGRGITLGEAELRALAAMDQGFRNLVAHPDADGDGAIDLLQGRYYHPQVTVVFTRGEIPALQGQVPAANGIDAWNFGVQVQERARTSYPPYASLQWPGYGPAQSQLGRLFDAGENGTSVHYAAFGSHQPGFPPSGAYTAGFDGRTLAFDLPDMSGLYLSVPEPIPSVVLNPDFTLREVRWVYRLADGSEVTAPPALVQAVQVQVETKQGRPPAQCPGVNGGSRAYEVVLREAATSHVLSCQKIPWGDVFQLFLGYSDVFGNNVLTGWVAP